MCCTKLRFALSALILTVGALEIPAAEPVFVQRLNQGDNFFVRATGFSPNGDVLAVASGVDGTPSTPGDVRLYSTKTGRLLGTLKGHKGCVTALAFGPDGKSLLTGGDDSRCIIWDMTTFRRTGQLDGHSAPITAVLVSPDGTLAVTASVDKKVTLWTLSTRQRSATLGDQNRVVTSLAFDPTGRMLAEGSQTGSIRVWSVARRAMAREWHGHERGIGGLAFLPDGKRLASSSGDGTVKIWDATNGLEKYAWRLGRAALCLTSSPDSRSIIVGCEDGEVVFCNVNSQLVESVKARQKREVLTNQTSFRAHDAAVTSVAIRSDGKLLASGGLDATVNLWARLPDFGE